MSQKKLEAEKSQRDVGGHVLDFQSCPLCAVGRKQLLMPPTQFGLEAQYLCEHHCVQTQSDHSLCYRALQGDTWYEYLCVVTVPVRRP